jgi:aldehyde:ferredoxin oxidoreductase
MQSVIPSEHDSRSRWRARDGLVWEGGDERVPIGAISAGDLSRQGMRHMGTDFYMSGVLAPWHVKNSGCTGCVMNCFSTVRGRDMPKGIPDHGEVNCVQMQTAFFQRSRAGGVVSRASRWCVLAGKQLADLQGVNSYDFQMQLSLLVQLRFGDEGSYYQALDAHLRQELDALPWDSIDEGGDNGLAFVMALFAAQGDAESGSDTLGAWLQQGTPRAATRFGMMEDIWSGAHGQYAGFEGFAVAYGAHGQRSHYGPDRYGTPAGLHWVIWNRDPNRHEHNGLASWSGLSWEEKRRVAEIHFGDPDLLDDPTQAWQMGPATPARIELGRMLAVRSMLKDSLTLCDWVFPNYCCPDPDREYAGDLELEAELYGAISGDAVGQEELDLRAEALVDLYRAITIRDWNTTDMRGAVGYQGGGRGHDFGGDFRGHDNLAGWYFDPDAARLDRGTFEEAKTALYLRLGWDPASGAVTRAKLEALGQGEVADGLAALGLLVDEPSGG